MKIDIHIHSSHSNDGSVSPKEILRYARKIDLDGIAITDHNELSGSLKILKENSNQKDFVVIPGVEVSSSEGHILALGITKTVPKNLTVKETIEKISDLGGLAIASHPFRFWSGLGEENVRKGGFEVIETINSRSLKKENLKSGHLAKELGCGKTGGSDSHLLSHIGNAYTVIENPSFKTEDILEDIRRGKSKGEGTSRRPSETPKYAAGCVYLWLKRGMKRI
ncbi:MAG: PHP domain-containing protein [Methanomassiliicoccales archaeon]|nr:MAG: PHP domain-containing protein [Methanomassiliicoccales archaeon]